MGSPAVKYGPQVWLVVESKQSWVTAIMGVEQSNVLGCEVYDDNGPDNITSLLTDKTLADVSYEKIHKPILGVLEGPNNGIFTLHNQSLKQLYGTLQQENIQFAQYPSSADSWTVSKGNTKWIPYRFNHYNEPSNLDGVFLLEIGV